MKAQIARWILRISGWKIIEPPPPAPSYIGIFAPHTSNWDFVLGTLVGMATKQRTKVLIKKELFFFPLGSLLRALGAMPIDRKKSGGVLKQALAMFDNDPQFKLFITPEGTRSLNKRWKTGFYFIAQRAQVPVYLSFADYKKKEAGFGPELPISDNSKETLERMQAYYKDITPKFPEQFDSGLGS